MAMDAIKFRKGIFDLVIHNSFPLSFLNTCISKSEGKMARNFYISLGKKNIINVAIKKAKEQKLALKKELEIFYTWKWMHAQLKGCRKKI